MRAFVVVVALLAGASCAPTPTCEQKVSLVDHDEWTLLPLDDDPWKDVAPPLFAKNADAGPFEGEPPLVLCADEDLSSEPLNADESLQLTTVYCSWMTVEQPVAVDVAAGEPVHVRLWHFQQTSYPRSLAEVVITLGDDVLVEESIAIPAASDLIGGDFPAPQAAPAGTPIRWHVGNHGGNTWNLIELSVLRDGPCPEP